MAGSEAQHAFLDINYVITAVGLLATGVSTLAGAVHRARSTADEPPEPLFSVGLLLTYGPAVYLAGGLTAVRWPSSSAPVNSILLLIGAITAHALVLWNRGLRGAQAHSETKEDGYGSSGITASFGLAEADQLRAALQRDLSRVDHIRMVLPDIRQALESTSPLVSAVRQAAGQGATVEILSDGSTDVETARTLLGGARQVHVVGPERVDTSGSWIMLIANRVAYFGLSQNGALDAASIARGVAASDKEPNLADSVHRLADAFFGQALRGEVHCRVTTSASPREYRSVILPAEAKAYEILRLPKRTSVIFKSESLVQSIAEKRFGRGTRVVGDYVREYRTRRSEFFSALARGMVCREIYNESELVTYASSGKHGSILLSPVDMLDTITRWRDVITTHGDYMVAITSEPIPLKYELIDERLGVIHETIGFSDLHRLNGLFIHGAHIGRAFRSDFETLWDRIPQERRTSEGVCSFIDTVLIPIAHERVAGINQPDHPGRGQGRNASDQGTGSTHDPKKRN